jgi:hypothetical protein
MALKKSAMRGCGSLFELLTSAFTLGCSSLPSERDN